MISNKTLSYISKISDYLISEVFVTDGYVYIKDELGSDILGNELMRKKITALSILSKELASEEMFCTKVKSSNINNEIIEMYVDGESVIVKENGILFLEIKKDKIVIFRESFSLEKIKSNKVASGSFEIKNVIDEDFNFYSDCVLFPKKTNILSKYQADEFLNDFEDKLSFLEEAFYNIENYLDDVRSLIITNPGEFVSSKGYFSDKECFLSDDFNIGINFLDDVKLSRLLDYMNIYIDSDKKFYVGSIASSFNNDSKRYYISLKKDRKQNNIYCGISDTGISALTLNSCYSFDGGSDFKVSVAVRDTFGELFEASSSFKINQGVVLEIDKICKYNNSDISGNYEIPYNQSAGKSSELCFGFESEVPVDDYGRFFDKETNTSLRFENLEFFINIPKKESAIVLYNDIALKGEPNGSNFIKYNFKSNYSSCDENSGTCGVFSEGCLKKIMLNNIYFSKNLANENINLYACLELEDGKKYEFYKNIKLVSNTIGDLSVLVDESSDSEFEFKITNSGPITEINSKVLSEFYEITLDDLYSLKSNVEVVGLEYYIYDGLNFSTADASTSKLTTEPLVYYIDKNEADNWVFREGQDKILYNNLAGIKYRVSRDSIDKNIYVKVLVKTTYGQEKDVTIKKNFKITKSDDSVSYFMQGYNVTDTLELEEGYFAYPVDVSMELYGSMSIFRNIKVELIGGSNWVGISSGYISFDAKINNLGSWDLSNFSSEEAKNFVGILPGSEKDFSALRFVFKKIASNPVKSLTAVKITLDSAFSSNLVSKELRHISSIIKEDYYSMEAINKSKPNGMPFVYKVIPIKETSDSSINSILLNKRLFLDCGDNRKSNISAIVYNKNFLEVSRASNESPSEQLKIPIDEYFYIVAYSDDEECDIDIKFTMEDPEIFFFRKELRIYNYFFKKNNSEYRYTPNYISEDGEDLNRTLFFEFFDFFKFSKKTDFLMDIYYNDKVFKSNVNIGYSRDEDFMDFSLGESYTKNISKIFKDYNSNGIGVTNLSLLNKSSMSLKIKSVVFNPYESSTPSNFGELSSIISKCYQDVFNPFSFNIESSIEIKHLSPKYENNNISIISY